MVHLRILGALLAFAIIVQCRDPDPVPPQPTPDPGPSGTFIEAERAPEAEQRQIEEVRL